SALHGAHRIAARTVIATAAPKGEAGSVRGAEAHPCLGERGVERDGLLKLGDGSVQVGRVATGSGLLSAQVMQVSLTVISWCRPRLGVAEHRDLERCHHRAGD